MTFIEPTAGRGALDDWSSIDWPLVERNVRRLQERIFRASQNGEQAQVKNLQKLLVRSRSAKLLAIRRVTQKAGLRSMPQTTERSQRPRRLAVGMSCSF